MRDSVKTRAIKPCDICGDGGWPEQIATCRHCKSAQEHIYCMKFHLCQRPKVWFCEECRSSKGQEFPRSVAQELCPIAFSFYPREDLRQSLGGPNVKLSSQSDLHLNPVCQTDTLITKSNGTSRFETSLSKVSPQEVNADSGVRATSNSNPLVPRNEEIRSMTQQKVLQTSKELKGNNWLVCKEDPVATLETLGIRVEKASEITPSTSIDALPITSSGDVLFADVQLQSINVQKCNRDLKDEPFNSFSLTSHAIWWSKEQYDSLLELIEMQGLVLKCCLNSVELLIFSSKSLDENSSGFKLGSFLWGAYRNVKGLPLLTNEVTSYAQADSSSARSKIKQSLSEVKVEPHNHPDVPPGFPRRAADADAGRSNQLSHV